VRLLPEGSVFADKGPGIFASNESQLFELLGWLNSRYARLFVEAQVAAGEEVQSGSASRSYEVGIVQRIPWPGPLLDHESRRRLSETAASVAEIVRGRGRHDELTRFFVRPATLPISESTLKDVVLRQLARSEAEDLEILSLTLQVDELLGNQLSMDEASRQYVDANVGPHPGSYRSSGTTDTAALIEDLYSRPVDELVDTVVDRVGGRRYLSTMSHYANRRLELIAHAARVDVDKVVAERQRLKLLPPGEIYRCADELFSYLFGIALGRWDVRVGCNGSGNQTLPSLLAGPGPSSPGMLVDLNGLPCVEEPDGYPIDLPPSRFLVDEPGHRWDIETRLRG
jgi:hypothetical protein